MMRTYEYTCDGGSIKIGNNDFSIQIANDYGDGNFYVRIGTQKEIDEIIPKSAKFVGSINGAFSIYKYDFGDEILCTLEGRYSILKRDGIIYLIRREK